MVAQALNAAMRTVPDPLEVHSLHGYFLRPTSPGSLTTHVVETVRDGRSFSTRQVISEVEGKETFRMTCSFHLPETGDNYQLPSHRRSRGRERSRDSKRPFPSMSVSSVQPSGGRMARTSRRAAVGSAPASPCPTIRRCTPGFLAYFSDMTGASFRPHSLGIWGTHTDASLDHALWFHRPWRADTWSIFDLHALVNAGGRATVRATMHGEDGTLHLSMAQEL